MKINFLTLLLLTTLVMTFTACGTKKTQDIEDVVEDKIDVVEDTIEGDVDEVDDVVATAEVTNSPESSEGITQDEAIAAALNHAGFTSEEVSGLYVESEMDDGVPEYEIQFYKDNVEYDYTIHAKTGAIISYDKDVEND